MNPLSALEREFAAGDEASDSGRGPLRLDVLGPQGETLHSLELGDGVLTVGQAPANQLVLEDSAIGRYHLRLASDGRQASVTDLGARGGTLLNDQPLTPNLETAFPAGATLRLGPFRLRLNQAQGTQQQASAAVPGALAAANLAMTIVGGRETLELTPGQPTVVVLSLSNSGAEVESARLSVEGMPSEWLRLPEQAISVQPGSTVSLPLQVQVPREPASSSGEYHVSIRGRTQGNLSEDCVVGARWTVLPFSGSAVEVRPSKRIVRGTAAALYTLAIENTGNQAESYSLSVGDDEPALDYQLDQSRVSLEPGNSAAVRLAVQARENPSGRSQNYTFSVKVRPSISAPIVATAQLSQQRPFPVWLIPVAALALIGLIGLSWFLWDFMRAGRAVAEGPQAGVTREATTDGPLGPTVGRAELSLEQALAGTQTAIAQSSQAELQATEIAAQIAAIRAEANPTVAALAAALEEARAAIAQASTAGAGAGGAGAGGGSSGGTGGGGNGGTGGGGSGGDNSNGGGSAAAPPALPIPPAAQTPLPTYTPFPTFTPFPTATASPTATSAPPSGTTPTPVPPPPQSKLVFASTPSGNSVAGQTLSWQPVIQIVDQTTEQPIRSYQGFATLSLQQDGCQQTPTRATNLGGSLTAQFVNGQAIFSSVFLECAGVAYTFRADVINLDSVFSGPFSVVAGAANSMEVTFGQDLPESIPAGQVLPSLQARAFDRFNNRILLTDQVNLTLNTFDESPADFSGGQLKSVTDGVVSFSSLKVNTVGRNYRFLVSTPGPNPITGRSPLFTIGGNQFEVSILGSSMPANTGVISVTVRAIDEEGSFDRNFSGMVTLAITGTQGAVLSPSANLRSEARNGLATFTNLSINRVGDYSFRATGGGLSGLSRTTLRVTADRIRFTRQPVNTPVGSPLSFTVEAGDGVNRDTSYNSAACSYELLGTPANPFRKGANSEVITELSSPMNAGLAGFAAGDDLHMAIQGSGYRIRATCTRVGFANLIGESAPFAITNGIARSLRIGTLAPVVRSAGVPFEVSVTALDRFNNPTTIFTQTINFTTLGAVNGAIGLNSTLVSGFGTNGTARFNVSINRSGDYQLIARSTADATFASPPGNLFSITASTVKRFVVSSAPAPSHVAGVKSISVSFEAYDEFANRITNFNGPITVGLAPASNPNNVMLRNITPPTFESGRATFSGMAIEEAASGYRLIATSNGATTPEPSAAFTVVADSVARFVVFEEPALSHVAGAATISVSFDAYDQFNNRVTSFSDLVTVALTPASNPDGAPLLNAAPTAANNGRVTFNGLAIQRASSGAGYRLIATSSGASTPVPSRAFSVTAGNVASLAVVNNPDPSHVAGANSISVSFEAYDQFANHITNFNGPLTVSLDPASNPNNATLRNIGSPTFESGRATFSGMNIEEAFSGYRLIASSNGATTLQPSTAFAVTPGALDRFAVVSNPAASHVAGVPTINVTFEARDRFDNWITSFNGPITVSLDPDNNATNASLLNVPLPTIINGRATFSGMAIQIASIDPGYRLIATSNGATTPVASDPFTVTGAAAWSLVFSTPPPATVTAGEPFTVRLQARDRFDNPTIYNGTVNLFASNEPVPLVGTAVFNNATQSAVSSNITLRRAGATTLIIDPSITDLLAPALNEQRNLTVNPAGVNQLVFLTQPPLSGLRNAAFTVRVRTLDQFNNLVTAANQIQLDLRQNNATVNDRLAGGAALLQNTTNGEAEFSVSIDAVGNGYTLRASVPAAAIGDFDSNAFTINPRFRMRFISQPTYCCVHAAGSHWFFVEIEVIDQNGNIDNQPIQLSVDILNENGNASGLTAVVWPSFGTTFTINGTAFTYVAVPRTDPNASRRLRFSAVDTNLGIEPLVSNAFLP